jgi:hypothetical protein
MDYNLNLNYTIQPILILVLTSILTAVTGWMLQLVMSLEATAIVTLYVLSIMIVVMTLKHI